VFVHTTRRCSLGPGLITVMPPDVSFAAKPTLRGELVPLRPDRRRLGR
jgi:hypothetical protein